MKKFKELRKEYTGDRIANWNKVAGRKQRPRQEVLALIKKYIEKSRKAGKDDHWIRKHAPAELPGEWRFYNKEFNQMMKESVNEDIGTITGIPAHDRWIDRILNYKKYKKAVRYYLNWRRSHPGDGYKAMQQAAKQMGLDFKNLNKVFHKEVEKGKYPKHLALPKKLQVTR